jgi:colanic acid/amylovoran biosynthesis glycosyltransferase
MKKDLLITTSSFPFNTEVQEAFLIAELDILAPNFRTIYICPSTAKISKKITLPENVKTIPIPNTLNLTWKLSSCFLLLNKHLWMEFFYGIQKIKTTNIGSFLKEIIIFLLISKKTEKEVLKIVKAENLIFENLILYSYWLNETSLSSVFLKLKYPKLTIISRAHSSEVYLHCNKNGYQPFKRKIMTCLNQVICVSSYLKKYINTNYQLENINIKVARLGTKKNLFLKRPIREGLKIISIGSADVKRIELLEAALKLIHEIKIEWHHYGSLNYRLDDYHLNKLVNCTHFGYFPNKELLSRMKNGKYDLLINVSSSEGIPVSVMEAMSHGIPCIATDVGGTSEIVTNENGQLLNSTPSLDEINTAIRNFHNLSPEQVNLKKQAAYETWFKKYNATKNYTQFVEGILSL